MNTNEKLEFLEKQLETYNDDTLETFSAMLHGYIPLAVRKNIDNMYPSTKLAWFALLAMKAWLHDAPKCDQCNANYINGIFCHEAGCPNSGKKWDAARQSWIKYIPCFICGYDVEEGESCSCQEDSQDE